MPEMAGPVARLNDPTTVENGLVFSAATAALALVDPRGLGAGGRLAYRGAIGALTGWTTWTAVRGEPGHLLPPVAKIGLTVGAAGVALGLCDAGEALDGRIHDRLVRLGVRRPRPLM